MRTSTLECKCQQTRENVFDDVGYTQRNGLTIALQTCHEEFLEALINHGSSVDDDGHNELLTVHSLHLLHLVNVGYTFTCSLPVL